MYVLSNFQGLKKFAHDAFVLNLQKKIPKVNFIEMLSYHGVTSFNGNYNIYQVNY